MTKEIYFAGGCFWGTERFFKLIEGVTATEVGYANGGVASPTYQQVKSGETGHAETVHVTYDPARVTLDFLLDMFFKAIDPTQLNRQGDDFGTQYRTGIYYKVPTDVATIARRVAKESERIGAPIATEVRPLKCFYRAEEYHQDYLEKNPDGYCHIPLALFEMARNAKP